MGVLVHSSCSGFRTRRLMNAASAGRVAGRGELQQGLGGAADTPELLPGPSPFLPLPSSLTAVAARCLLLARSAERFFEERSEELGEPAVFRVEPAGVPAAWPVGTCVDESWTLNGWLAWVTYRKL